MIAEQIINPFEFVANTGGGSSKGWIYGIGIIALLIIGFFIYRSKIEGNGFTINQD